MRLALTAAACLTPLRLVQHPLLLIEDGILAALSVRSELELPRNTRVVDFPGAILAPGFIDLHVHGGAGHDVMSATPEGLAAFERHLARHGVSSYCPTTVTAPVDITLAALERLANRIERSESEPTGSHNSEPVRARPLGIHLEGPFISHEKRGVHPAEFIREASLELFGRFWDAARGHLKLLTVAPELPGAIELIAEASRRGICVALGHSNADYETARRGIAAGARHAVHTFNAMRALDHRAPGLVAAILNTAGVSAEIICDGVHVAPAMVELFLRVKGSDDAVLVTDAISATGMPDGRYRLGELEVNVEGNRCVSDEGKLAGSVLTMDRAVRNVMDFASWDLPEAVRLATRNPARVLGMELRYGTLRVGAPADVAVMTAAGEVLHTLVRGAGV